MQYSGNEGGRTGPYWRRQMGLEPQLDPRMVQLLLKGGQHVSGYEPLEGGTAQRADRTVMPMPRHGIARRKRAVPQPAVGNLQELVMHLMQSQGQPQEAQEPGKADLMAMLQQMLGGRTAQPMGHPGM